MFDDSKSNQMNGKLFWECCDSSVWFSWTVELDFVLNNKHTKEQIPQHRSSNGHFSKISHCSYHKQGLEVGNGDKHLDENGQYKVLDGKMASKQKFQNNVTDTMI